MFLCKQPPIIDISIKDKGKEKLENDNNIIITLLVWEFGYGDKELVKEPSENKSG